MARIVVEAAKGDPAAAEKLLGEPENRQKVAVLAIVADRGLSGPYNSSVLRATDRLLADLRRQQIDPLLFSVGKKGQSYFRFRHEAVAESFVGISGRPSFADARDVAVGGRPRRSSPVRWTRSCSSPPASARRAFRRWRSARSCPFPTPPTVAEGTEAARTPGATGYTEFEPDVESLLSELAPRAVESEIFTALLEGAASFFTAQQRAMAAASENADELVRTLSRVMNRARQDAITTEIMEIVGGAEALRHSKGA